MQAILNNLITQFQHLDIEINAEEFLDCLWLAAHKAKHTQQSEKFSESEQQTENPPFEEPSILESSFSKSESNQQEYTAELYTSQQSEKNTEIANNSENALPFHTPAASALPHSLQLSRALRPLVRRIASLRNKEIDEQATVRKIADTGIWLPTFRPKPVRWLELFLVIDDSPSMRLWHHTVNELQTLFEQQGAFSDVRVWRLKTTVKNQQVSLHTSLGTAARHYKELINPAQKRLILLVTDCISPAWLSETLLTWLTAWGRQHPVSIINMLPQQLWAQTQLRNARLVKLSNKQAGVANYYLHQQQTFPARQKKLETTGLAIPLTTLEPEFLTSWAKFVVGQEINLVPGFVFQIDDLFLSQAPMVVDENKYFDQFRAVASPTAYQLACYLAAAPLRLPIMRLVQRIMLPESEQVHLAEVFLSGLLKRVNFDSCSVDEIEYDFLSDALRERLLDAGLLTDAVLVQKLISDYIDKHYGSTLGFKTVLSNPDAADDFVLTHKHRGFAKISATILSRLGGDYQTLADKLNKKIETSEILDDQKNVSTEVQLQTENPPRQNYELLDMLGEDVRIKVIGVGSGGGNVVEHMVKSHIDGVQFICANTDAQALRGLSVETKVQLGVELTKGLGARTSPEIGKQAAEENREHIKEVIDGAAMVFLTAGMGGGTGTGAISVIAEVAKEMGVLTIAVVTKPFDFEGTKKKAVAEAGIVEVEKHVDSLIIIPNQKLLPILESNLSLINAFKAANDVLLDAVQGITELITHPGLINVDFADVKMVMSNMGTAIMGSGSASGDNRAREAAEKAIACPLLEDDNLQGAHGILVNITAADMDLTEFDEIGSIIHAFASEDADMKIGTAINPDMGNEIKVTIFATGMDEIVHANSPNKLFQKVATKGKKQLFNNLLDNRYQELVAKHHIQSDDSQIKVLGILQKLLDGVSEQISKTKHLVSSKLQKHTQNLYIFGSEGGEVDVDGYVL